MSDLGRYEPRDSAELYRILLFVNFSAREKYSITLADGSRFVGIAFIVPKYGDVAPHSIVLDGHFIIEFGGQRLRIALADIVSLHLPGSPEQAVTSRAEAALPATATALPRWLSILGTVAMIAGVVLAIYLGLRKNSVADPGGCVENEIRDCKTESNVAGRQICHDGRYSPDCTPFVSDGGSAQK